MINIIRRAHAIVDLDHVTDQAHDVILGNSPMCDWNNIFKVKLLVQFIATNLFEVVMP